MRLLLLLQRQHIHADGQAVLAAADTDAGDWWNVAVVAAPGECQVVGAAECVVGGVAVDPFAVSGVDGAPGVRCVGAHQARLPGGRNGAEVTADVASGQSD